MSCISPALDFVAKCISPPHSVALRRNVAAHVPDALLEGKPVKTLSGAELRHVQRGLALGQREKQKRGKDKLAWADDRGEVSIAAFALPHLF